MRHRPCQSAMRRSPYTSGSRPSPCQTLDSGLEQAEAPALPFHSEANAAPVYERTALLSHYADLETHSRDADVGISPVHLALLQDELLKILTDTARVS